MVDREPAHAGVGILFVGVARRWRAAIDSALAPTGLSDATWRPLLYIDCYGGGAAQTELASTLGISGSSLVRLIDVLVEKHLVERHPRKADRRSHLLVLTPDGFAAVQHIRQVLTRIEQQMLADLSDGEIETFTKILKRVDASIKLCHDRKRRP